MKLTAFVTACVTALVTLSVTSFAFPGAARAQTDWPQRPVTLVVPYPPGGVNDAVARGYANKLAVELGKPVVVENRAGAATTVASNHVARAPADGYTIYAAGTSLVINPTLTGQVQYDPNTSLAVTPTTAKPARGPLVMVSRMPFSTEGMNSFGITPPVISLRNRKSSLMSAAYFSRSSSVMGDISTTTWPYWPLPPDCLACL